MSYKSISLSVRKRISISNSGNMSPWFHEMEYLGLDVAYCWWKPAASTMPRLQNMPIRDDPKKGLHDIRSFICTCHFYWRHTHKFTSSSAPLTEFIKKTKPWGWINKVQACFKELKKKISSTNCLGVPLPKGEKILLRDTCDVRGAGILYQWQEHNPAELAHCQYPTSGLNRDGTLKQDYPANQWRLVPLGHWNWNWNQARSNYSTYDR